MREFFRQIFKVFKENFREDPIGSLADIAICVGIAATLAWLVVYL
jgi:uncharacterized membrane protein